MPGPPIDLTPDPPSDADMVIRLTRFGFGLDSTLGRMQVPGEEVCFTIEDERRIQKVHGETAIPAGTYRLELRREGGFHDRYTRRFPAFHKGMIHVLDVPDFTWILIHVGNGDQDTAGCILVGEVPIVTRKGEFRVGASVDAYARIYPPVADALEEGKSVDLVIEQAEPLP